MSKAIRLYNDFDDLQRVASALSASGYFKDSKAQAIAKVVAGAEIGLPPFASMAGIHIIKGKPTLGSNLIATLVENDPRYEYKVLVSNDFECKIEWCKNGERQGEAGFTIEEAQKAGLTNKGVWQKYPSDLLFARAMTRGARRYAAGIFGGAPVYTPEELGEDEIIDITPEDPEMKKIEEVVRKEFEKPEPPPTEEDVEEIVRPYTAKTLKAKFAQAMATYQGENPPYQVLAAQLGELLDEDADRYALTRYLTGNEGGSTKNLSNPQLFAFSVWLCGSGKLGFDTEVKEVCKQEAQAALTAAKKAEGQEELL